VNVLYLPNRVKLSADRFRNSQHLTKTRTLIMDQMEYIFIVSVSCVYLWVCT
jgi:hypothetical protein